MTRTTEASSPDHLIPVMQSPRVRAWPGHDEGGSTTYITLAPALTTSWSTDAHLAAYSAPEIARRLDSDAPEELDGVAMVLLVVDIDSPEAHRDRGEASEAWRCEQRARIAALRTGHPEASAYETRGGLRVVARLATPHIITGPRGDESAAAWRRWYLRQLGYLSRRYDIVGDPSCGDWTRLYRCPRVVRDGVRQDYPTHGSTPGVWHYAPTGADDDADVAAVRGLAASVGGAWNVAVRHLEPPARPAPREPLLDAAGQRGRDVPHATRAAAYFAAASRELLREIEEAPDGNQNNTIRDNALRLFRLALAANESLDAVAERVLDASVAGGHPAHRAANTIESARKAAEREGPAQIPDRPLPQRPGRGPTMDEHPKGAVTPNAAAWPAPTPLDAPPAVPPFPVDALSPWHRDFAVAAADVLQVQPDLPGLLSLPFVGAAAAQRCEFEPWPGWTEPPALYTLAVALSGENKSAVLSVLRRPVEDVQRALRRDAVDVIREATSTRATAEIRVKHLREAVAKGKADRGALSDAVRELDEIHIPNLPNLMFGGVATPVATTMLLAKNDERQLVAAAEGGATEAMTGLRYGKGMSTVNVDLMLQAHGGEPVIVHRVGRESVALARPLLSFSLAVQPIVLKNAAQHPDLLHRGVIPRVIVVWPDSMVGRRDMGVRVWPEGVREGYEDRMRALWSGPIARNPDGSPAPVCIPFSEEARDLFVAWRTYLEPRRAPGGPLADPPVMAAWSNKLDGACVRVAGVLHIADRLDPDGVDLGGEIDAATLRRAIRLCEYFEAHAVRAFAAVTRHNPAEEDARAILASLRRAPPSGAVSTRDVQRRRSECTAERALAALDLLAEHGFVRPLPPPSRSGPGRPAAPQFEVHPSIASPKPEAEGHSVHIVNETAPAEPPRERFVLAHGRRA